MLWSRGFKENLWFSSLNFDGNICQETKQQEGRENKRIESVTAPMGAIVEDYRALSDLSLHTGYVINIYVHIY